MAKHRRRRRSSKASFGLKKGTVRWISAICFFVFGVLSFASIFSKALLLAGINSGLSSLFGVGLFFVPILLLTTSLYLFKIKLELAKAHVSIGLAMFLVAFVSVIAAFSEKSSGQVGLSIWTITSQLLTSFGAFFVSVAAVIIGLLILFNTTYEEAIGMVVNGAKALAVGVSNFVKSKGKGAGNMMPRRPEPKIQGGDIAQNQSNKSNGNLAQPQHDGLGTAVVANLPSQGFVWEYPPLSLLSETISKKAERGDIKQNASIIERTLDSFGIQARVAEINLGPAVTQYALEIALGTKLSKITALQNDLALALAAPTGTVRIEAPIPGKSLVGIEIPNQSLEIVSLKSILSSDVMISHKSRLAVALGYDVSGQPILADIAKMPHLLMAGTTGSGKSVAINTFICSLLFRCSPQELKLILVDPKRVELSGYNNIPHLLTPVIVDVDKILAALKWATSEMDRRYKLFAQVGVRNIEGYNEISGFQALPYIVIVIDELADLMIFAPVEVEDAITRLAQMARATGIHLIIATQRPSVDVITGLIKANIPARIAFNVSSMVDSRVIIDQPGAEKLLGRGDMLYVPPDASKPVRIQGVYADPDVNPLVEYLKQTGVAPEFTQEVTEMVYQRGGKSGGGGGEKDTLFDEAVRTVCQYDRASASLLQRRLKVGYARAARLIDELEAAGIVGAAEGAKPRDVLVRNADEYFAQRGQATG